MPKFVSFLAALVLLSTACTPAGPQAPVTPPTSTVAVPPGGSEACTYFNPPKPTANQSSLFAPVSANEHIQGPASAYLTVVEYSDFQCTACAKFALLMAQIQQKHPRDIRIVFRNYPLITLHDKAALATQAAEAASLQGKFWQMHDLLFQKQSDWIKLDKANFQAWLAGKAASLGLDPAKFAADLASPAIAAIPVQALKDGFKIAIPYTPFILVNGEILKWQPTLLDELDEIIRLDLLPEHQFHSCPPTIIDTAKQYYATLKTAKGDIVIRLFADKAPNTVNNFVFLAQKGWYDNITFQRVIPGFVAQTGDPSGTGQGNPGYFIPDEIDRTLQYDRPGLVGMSNSGPDTNGSQFFITYSAQAALTGVNTLFGQVVSGMDVLNKLTPRNPIPGQNLPDGDLLISITIEAK